MTIVVPAEFEEFLREQAAAGQYSSVDDYVASLLDDERREQARARLAAELRLGLASGPPEPMTAAEWDQLRDEVRSRAALKSPAT